MAGAPGTRWTKIRFVVGVAIGLAAVSTVVSSAGGIADALGAIRHLDVGWFVVGAIAECLSFVALGGLLRRLVGREAASPGSNRPASGW